MSQLAKYKLKSWLKDYLDYLDWNELSENPGAIDLLKQHPEKINENRLCVNTNIKAIDLIEKIKDINFKYLSVNANAIHILKKNPDKIDTFQLTTFRNITEYYRGNFVVMNNFIFNHVDLIINTCKPKLIVNNINWTHVLYNYSATDLIDKAFEYDIKLINFSILCSNKNIVYFFKKYDILKKYVSKIDWEVLCMNRNAIPIIDDIILCYEKYIYTMDINIKFPLLFLYIKWDYLSLNENAVHILEKYTHKINFENLSLNRNAMHLIQKYIYKIDMRKLSANESAIEFFKKNPKNIVWEIFSSNRKGIPLFKENAEKVHWNKALLIKDPEIIDIVGTYVEKIQKAFITDNSHVLKEVKRMLNWTILSKNPYIFELDCKAMAEKFEPLSKELNDYLCNRPHLLPMEYESEGTNTNY